MAVLKHFTNEADLILYRILFSINKQMTTESRSYEFGVKQIGTLSTSKCAFIVFRLLNVPFRSFIILLSSRQDLLFAQELENNKLSIKGYKSVKVTRQTALT